MQRRGSRFLWLAGGAASRCAAVVRFWCRGIEADLSGPGNGPVLVVLLFLDELAGRGVGVGRGDMALGVGGAVQRSASARRSPAVGAAPLTARCPAGRGAAAGAGGA